MKTHRFELFELFFVFFDDLIDEKIDTRLKDIAFDLVPAVSPALLQHESLFQFRDEAFDLYPQIVVHVDADPLGFPDQMFESLERIVQIDDLERVELSQLDTAQNTLQIVYLFQRVGEILRMVRHLFGQVVTTAKLLFVADGIEQALFEETFSDGGGGQIDQFEQRHLVGIAADDVELFQGVVAQIDEVLSTQKDGAVHLFDQCRVVFDDEVDQQ